MGRVVSQECEELSGLKPKAVEADFGKDDELLTVSVPDGPPLGLRGRLDRLDVGPGVVRITDYKHTANKSSLKDPVRQDALGVSAFQLPVYLAAAAKMLDSKEKTMIARIVPTRLTNEKTGQITYEPGDLFLADDQISRRRAAKEGQLNLYNAISAIWERITSGDFSPRPDKKNCGFCGFGGFCRARVGPTEGGEDG